MKRRVVFYERYFLDFFDLQHEYVKEKILYVLFLVETTPRIPVKFFKAIENYPGLYEIRIEYQSNIFRVFCCFDEGNLIILFQGYTKKTAKTPKDELEKAKRLKNEYFAKK